MCYTRPPAATEGHPAVPRPNPWDSHGTQGSERAVVTCAQAWLLLGRSPTSPPVMLYLWRRTAGVTPRWNDARASCGASRGSLLALLTTLRSAGKRCSPPTAAEHSGTGGAVRAQCPGRAGQSPGALHHCPTCTRAGQQQGLESPALQPWPREEPLQPSMAEPQSQPSIPCTFHWIPRNRELQGAPQPHLLQVARTEVQVLGELCRDRVGQRGPHQALLALHIAVELGPGEQALGRAATQGQHWDTGTASQQGTGQGWERGTATTEWGCTRTQGQPPQDGTVVRHRDTQHRASRAGSSPWSSPCRQVTLQKVKGGDTPAVLYTVALQPLQNCHQRGWGRLDQVPELLQGHVLPWGTTEGSDPLTGPVLPWGHRGVRYPHGPRGPGPQGRGRYRIAGTEGWRRPGPGGRGGQRRAAAGRRSAAPAARDPRGRRGPSRGARCRGAVSGAAPAPAPGPAPAPHLPERLIPLQLQRQPRRAAPGGRTQRQHGGDPPTPATGSGEHGNGTAVGNRARPRTEPEARLTAP